MSSLCLRLGVRRLGEEEPAALTSARRNRISAPGEFLMRRLRQEIISVWVRDPRIRGKDFWHAHIDYEICMHTNSMCFTKKTSCVRRRFSEFVWLRQKLQENTHLMELPALPPKNPFFSLNNSHQVNKRMKGLQHFLDAIVQKPLVLSDSCLHLFLQSQLSIAKMEACASGRTSYSVAQAIQSSGSGIQRFRSDEDLSDLAKDYGDSDCESTASSGLGLSCDTDLPREEQSAQASGTSEEEPR